jgi:hypothetical protein
VTLTTEHWLNVIKIKFKIVCVSLPVTSSRRRIIYQQTRESIVNQSKLIFSVHLESLV